MQATSHMHFEITTINPPHENTVATRPTKTKRQIACNFCRAKKIRCNGGTPCTNCLDHKEECVTRSRRRTRSKSKSATESAMAQRLARIEALLRDIEPTSSDMQQFSGSLHNFDVCNPDLSFGESTALSSNSLPSLDQGEGREAPHDRRMHSPANTITAAFSTVEQEVPGSMTVPGPSHSSTVPRGIGSTFAHSGSLTLSSISAQSPRSLRASQPPRFESEAPPPSYQTNSSRSPACTPDEKQEINSVYTGETSNWEYHGPRSYLSICSKPGIQWVAERTGSPLFQESASTLTRDVTRRLKIERNLSKERTPEPEPAVAWRYSQAYFDGASDAVFGIVNRSWFENRLQSHLSNPRAEEDPAWYALRNAIYASGCRLELSKRCTFREAYQAGWSFFENALSVHTELLYFRTSLLAVEALTVMAYYTECIGSPCLEYMLCANASRLAYSKGLHRQPVPSWNLSTSEECHRTWLFWVIYCLEKHCSFHSGRPSTINDHEISCQVLTVPPPGGSINVEHAANIIKLAQMMSLVAEKFSSIQRNRQSPEAWANAVAELDVQHVELGSFLGDLVSLDTPLDNVKLPAGISVQQATYIRLTYFSISLDIHTTLTCPWSQLREHPTLRSQVHKSADIVARTARAAILATHFIRIDASTPILLAFFAPMYALINLFIHILQNPDLPTVQSDLALMDIGAAHFARLEFATDSEIPIAFAKEIAALARTAVKYNKALSLQGVSNLTAYGEMAGTAQDGSEMVEMGDNGHREMSNSVGEGQATSQFDLELDHWSTLLPLHDFDDGQSLLDVA